MANKKLSEKELEEILLNLSDNEDDVDVDKYTDSESDSEVDNYSVASELSDTQSEFEDIDANNSANNSESNNANNDIETESDNQDEPIKFFGKDGTEWSRSAFPTGRARAHNIIKGSLSKVCLPQGVLIEEPVDAFLLYINKQIVDKIVNYTNQEAIRVIGPEKWKNCDSIELYAFIGLLITAGHLKSNYTNYDVLWNRIYGPPIFRATMGLKRFKLLLRFIRFDDKTSRSERRKKDKLAPIRDIWNLVNTNFKKFYTPGDNITIDEQLLPFRGRCSFRQYMPSKPDKYGLKIWWACDSENYYPLNGLPYVGKEGNNVAKNLGRQVVETLAEPFYRSKRNITCDNYFTDLDLAYNLLSNGLTLVGTVRKNKRFIPKEFQPHKSRDENSSVFGFTKKATLVSYVPKPKKSVIVLSTMHHSEEVSETDKHKPEIILKYNQTKCGVDSLDQMVHEYMCKRRTNRWPFAYFMNILDVSGVAAYVVWKKLFPSWNNKKHEKRRLFLINIAESLVVPEIQRRNLHGVSKTTKTCMLQFVPSTSTATEPRTIPENKKRRCHICPAKRARMQRQTCDRCNINVCNDHCKTTRVCSKCEQE